MKLKQRMSKRRERRSFRVRNNIRATAVGRPRLSVFRSNLHMYAQIIDDSNGETLVSASTVQKDLGGAGKYAGNKAAAAKVGQAIAKLALGKGITKVVFDRGPYKYHGRVEALAAAAREAGLEF